MDKPSGFSIRIFLPDGSPDGLRIIEKSNWSGRGVVCPRPLFPKAKSRSEFGKTGVYILLGPSEVGDVQRLYIGEGDPVLPRLDQHAAKKDFWTSVIFFISKDENLNKAHIQYLESKLITLAREAQRCELDNTNSPELPTLSEMDAADAEGFLAEMILCLPILGVTAFSRPETASREKLLYIKARGIKAQGHETNEGFLVLKGSTSSITQTPSAHQYITNLRDNLRKRGILQKKREFYVLTENYTFNSPSTAAAVMTGRNENGRVLWKDKSGRTLKEIQESQIAGKEI